MDDVRWFIDARGTRWTSRIEHAPDGGASWIRFDSDRGARRSRPDPALVRYWRDCSALELEELLGDATPVD